MAECAIGIDLGGTFIKAGVVDSAGRIMAQTSLPTGVEDGAEAVIQRMGQAAEEARNAAGVAWGQVRALGIGSPGVLDLVRGVPLIVPNLRCIEGQNLPRGVAQALGLRDVPVVLENDANAAAFGEQWAGAGRDVSTLVMFTLGTGIGGGIILDGHIWHGTQGFAGELGHVAIFADGRPCPCNNRGCLEVYASAPAMIRRFREAVAAGRPSSLAEPVGREDPISGKDIYEAAVAGDVTAREAIEETGRFLGMAATNVIHILNPEMVVFAGGLTGAGDMLLNPIREEARARTFNAAFERVQIVFAELGNDAGLIGAAGWALKTSATSAS